MKFEVESKFVWVWYDNHTENSYAIMHRAELESYSEDYPINYHEEFPAIQEPQILRILVALDILFESLARNFFYNLEWLKIEDKSYPLGTHTSEILCNRWLDGLEPLFDREPETVLQELVEILENLMK